MDEVVDDVVAIVEDLLCARGVFQADLHFDSSRATLRLLDDPYDYQVLVVEELIDATVRLIPRVLGNQASVEEESFSTGLLEHPQYTKPADWNGRAIPEVLLSGHHAKITDWRQAMAERLTKERRPDLWRAYCESHDMDPDKD